MNTLFNVLNRLWLIPIFIVLSSCLKDIRPDFMFSEQYKNDNQQEKAEALLQVAAHNSGLENWNKVSNYDVSLTDEFFGLMGKMAMPYKESKIDLKLNYNLNNANSIIEFDSGKEKGKKWKYIEGKYIMNKSNSDIAYSPNKEAQFWIPTYQYFLELTFRISSGQIIRYAGTKTLNNTLYDLVFVSWKGESPQKDFDQYILWLNKKNGLIEMVEYTVRDEYSFISACAIYTSYQTIDGITLPKKIEIKSNLNSKKSIHHMQFENFRLHYN